MANFLSSCACHGARPKSVEIKDMHIRESLVSKLMSQRNVLRFISAPSGFGKSVLAAQYADIVFSFKKVFWIDCQSPCFIRDLDSNSIVSQIIQLCDSPSLVVFDNLCSLDESRSYLFSQVIDELLEYHVEVIVNARPYKDSFIKFQNDALIIRSKELLVSHEETNSENLSDINRIPILYWEASDDPSILLKKAVTEDFADSIVVSLFLIYLFKKGSLDLIKKYLSKSEFNLLIEMSDDYLYFGIDENKSSFSVPSIFTSKLISLFNSNMHILINAMSVTDRSGLAEKLCSLLEGSDNYQASVDVACCLGDKKLRKRIIEKYNEDSIRRMYLLNACNLYNKLYDAKNNPGLNLVFQSIRLAILGRTDDAIRYSYNVMDSNYSSVDNKLLAALVFMRFGNHQEKNQAIKILRNLNNDFKIDTYLNSSRLSSEELFKCKLIKRLAEIYFVIYSRSRNPFEKWLNSVEGEMDRIDTICAEAIFDNIDLIDVEHIKSKSYSTFISTISRFYSSNDDDKFDFYAFALIDKYNSVKDEIYSLAVWKINEDLYKKHNSWKDKFLKLRLEAEVYDKNSAYAKNLKKQLENNENKNFQAIESNRIPKLRLNVLGGLTAFLGDKEIIDSSFGRQNIKLLCCILTLENGNEVGKDDLANIIWPGSDPVSQRHNINAHWSVLRGLFTLQNGECPYLIRNQNSYKLVKRYFSSDIQTLEKICSELTLGPIDSQSWWEQINKYENVVDGSLLPSERNNIYIENKRNVYKNIIVDALVAAANRLIDAGEVQQSLWFAHKALSRDSQREDVFIALMKAQMAAGQRTPALETYFACKKFLEEDLGIDPSKKLYGMYEKVVHETGK